MRFTNAQYDFLDKHGFVIMSNTSYCEMYQIICNKENEGWLKKFNVWVFSGDSKMNFERISWQKAKKIIRIKIELEQLKADMPMIIQQDLPDAYRDAYARFDFLRTALKRLQR